MKKLPDGRVVECKCGMCRTSLRGEEVLNPIEELPMPIRWYLYGAWLMALGSVILVALYIYY